MADRMSKEKRSLTMSKIRSKNTSPELHLRSLLWREGKRFRIHDKTVFGTPDISNKKKMISVFIDGCFWHGCNMCHVMPKTNVSYWKNKFQKNKERRIQVIKKLSDDNWLIIQVWEHDLKDNPNKVLKNILDVWK